MNEREEGLKPLTEMTETDTVCRSAAGLSAIVFVHRERERESERRGQGKKFRRRQLNHPAVGLFSPRLRTTEPSGRRSKGRRVGEHLGEDGQGYPQDFGRGLLGRKGEDGERQPEGTGSTARK